MTEHDPRDDYDDEPWRGQLAPNDRVRLPASMMWVFGLLQLTITQLGVAVLLSGWVAALADGEANFFELWNTPKERIALWLTLGGWVFGTVCTITVMRAANDLRRFRRYRRVVLGAVLTLLAVPFFYLGIVQMPLGVWLIWLLIRRDVRARFDAVARGTINVSPPEAGDARIDSTP